MVAGGLHHFNSMGFPIKRGRGLDIGANKPSPAEQALAVHHLLDVVDPADENWNAPAQRFPLPP